MTLRLVENDAQRRIAELEAALRRERAIAETERRRAELAEASARQAWRFPAWHLQASDIGSEARGDFHADTSLPPGFVRITKANYNNSGFDRF